MYFAVNVWLHVLFFIISVNLSASLEVDKFADFIDTDLPKASDRVYRERLTVKL